MLAKELFVNPPLQISQAVFPEFCLTQPAQCSCSRELSITTLHANGPGQLLCSAVSFSTGQHSVSKNGEEAVGENKVT